MISLQDTVAVYGYAAAALAYLAFGAYALIAVKVLEGPRHSGALLVAATMATSAWATLCAMTAIWNGPALPILAAALDLARYALWFAFLLSLFWSAGLGRLQRMLQYGAIGTVLLASVLLGQEAQRPSDSAPTMTMLGSALALAVCGLLLVEQLFRNLDEDSRWNAKPVCLGLVCIFVFDIYLYAQALLFGRFDIDVVNARGLAHLLAVPFLVVATRRGSAWLGRMKVSRAAAFYSATLILSGIYLLFMSAIGSYVRVFGGSWGGALQVGLLVAGLAFLGALVLSGALRSWLRVFVGKHFFSYRYDYREEWLRFTGVLSSRGSPQEMGEQIVRGLAKLVECPGGSLWTRDGDDAGYSEVARWNTPHVAEVEAEGSSLCTFLRDEGWVIDLDEFRSSPRRYEKLALPTWLLGATGGWLIVPLMVGDVLLGFVFLTRPLTTIKLNWEVLDLLKTAGRQAASYLAQMQATEALLEARKFDAFNRMSAFVVHDLKNIVTQLSLMLKNAERLHDNREFQQDMLLTVESSLEKMKRLMLQLREGATAPGGGRGVELGAVFKRLSVMAASQGRTLHTEEVERLSTRGHEDRLERVLGHLVQNAIDATPPSGRVWIRASRHSGQVHVEVGDTGMGMSEDFVRTRLFRPFNTTKQSGMGIGSYESFQYVHELGGSMSVDSQSGKGTVITVQLPLFDPQRGSDLLAVKP